MSLRPTILFPLFLFSILLCASFASAYTADETIEELHRLFKREDKLPYDSLPSDKCNAPTVCSNIQSPVNCRCSDMLTVCQNNNGQYCWGSQLLNQTTGCPAVPESCSAQFNGTANCLCNGDTVLCVDGYNHYCYGNYQGSSAAPGSSAASSASVSLGTIPTTVSSLSGSGGGDANQSNNPSSDSGAQSPISSSLAAWTLLALTGSTAYFVTL
ncbi:hypothetical protein RO3G_14139 [Lichtheimia corymbifera JMRC:FSU:9682]|uniref:Extracellular membrane protein CFEM domain-containing protein n=1 Tax=Lichtheimia corymbifera JMRC:FSU:9682 TaxID=1263082 RepID=A0A068SED8_9FUNG|nr:hypothetical protein RO3G_14139 [Lichtheimia corymbifera JMRC:FSU:9682]CDH59611.1 hypothetical protein RO3G_14139 [Lichtheimia corymbifera JMRC:FSU:9682]